jgi:hypothetical protein
MAIPEFAMASTELLAGGPKLGRLLIGQAQLLLYPGGKSLLDTLFEGIRSD